MKRKVDVVEGTRNQVVCRSCDDEGEGGDGG